MVATYTLILTIIMEKKKVKSNNKNKHKFIRKNLHLVILKNTYQKCKPENRKKRQRYKQLIFWVMRRSLKRKYSKRNRLKICLEISQKGQLRLLKLNNSALTLILNPNNPNQTTPMIFSVLTIMYK